MIRISVIIPTIGRESLIDTIDSVLDQCEEIHEIIVIGSKPGLNLEFRSPKVKFVEADSFSNISSARNKGLKHVCPTSNFIGFCDDDDLWLKNKINLQLATIKLNEWDACLTSAYLVNHKGITRVRPSKPYTGDISPLRFIYGLRDRKEKYLPFPSLLCATSAISTLRFNENLLEREDLNFLEDMYNLNLKIGQITQPLVRITSNPERSIQRVSFKKDLKWMLILYKTSIFTSLNFIFFVSLRNQLFRMLISLKSKFRIR